MGGRELELMRFQWKGRGKCEHPGGVKTRIGIVGTRQETHRKKTSKTVQIGPGGKGSDRPSDLREGERLADQKSKLEQYQGCGGGKNYLPFKRGSLAAGNLSASHY